jgi:hypothetical protein
MLHRVPFPRLPLSAALADITARLVDGSDQHAVLSLVIGACDEFLGSDAVGVMVVDPRGGVDVVSASDGRARFVELLQTQIDQGPCIDAIRGGRLVEVPDLDQAAARWPRFTPAALAAGYRAVYALPMKLDGRAVGGLNLLFAEKTVLGPDHLPLAQALADLALLGLTQEPAVRRAERLSDQVLSALNDRVHFDQAVGMVAGTLGVEPDAARAAMDYHARRHGLALRDISRAITDGALGALDLSEAEPPEAL